MTRAVGTNEVEKNRTTEKWNYLAASMEPPARRRRRILILYRPNRAVAVAPVPTTYFHPIGFGYTTSDNAKDSILRTALITSVFVAP